MMKGEENTASNTKSSFWLKRKKTLKKRNMLNGLTYYMKIGPWVLKPTRSWPIESSVG